MLRSIATDDVSSDEGSFAINTANRRTPKGKWRPPDRECVLYMYNGIDALLFTACTVHVHN